MRYILIILITFCLSSCSIFKKSLKTKDIEKVETNISIEKDSSNITIDKSTLLIKEKVDTTIVVPEKVITSEKKINLDSLLKGVIAIKDDLVDVQFDYNEITGVLKTTAIVKKQKIPIKINKITTVQKDVVSKTNVKAIIQESNSSVKKKVVVEKKPDYLLIIILGLIITGLILSWKWIKNNIIKKFFPLI